MAAIDTILSRRGWNVLGLLGMVLLLTLGLFVAFGPRAVSVGEVGMLCEREVRRQTATLGTLVVEDFRQTDRTAHFTLQPLTAGGGTRTRVTCSVSGNARKPTITLQMRP